MSENAPAEEAAAAPEQTNASAIDTILGQMLPDLEPPDPTALKPVAISHYSALAQDPKLGEKFTLGDRTFTRQFLTIDAEQDLIEIVLNVIKDAPQGDLAAGFMGSVRESKTAAAIILKDQTPEADAAWLSSQRGVTTNQLIALVIAQMQINEVTPLLGKLLALAGLAGALKAGSIPA